MSNPQKNTSDTIELPSSLKKIGHFLLSNSLNTKYFYGQENELKKLNIIRHKTIKNNVLIIGNPGTGKTTLVEAYAHQYDISNIFVVECAKLISNTEYRGSFEQKVIELVNFAQSMHLILFFDELHVLIDMGKSQGGISITDILKPYLLDSDLVFIGATTIKESMFLMHDEAFQRRFTPILLDEPTDIQLLSIKKKFEETVVKKQLLTDQELMKVIAILREKLVTQYFPDNLIDFLDYTNAYQTVINCNINYIDLLEEYINDQRLAYTNI